VDTLVRRFYTDSRVLTTHLALCSHDQHLKPQSTARAADKSIRPTLIYWTVRAAAVVRDVEPLLAFTVTL
jgi:hypothetical protein